MSSLSCNRTEKVDILDQGIPQSHDLSDHQTQLKHREQYAALTDRLKTIIAPHMHLPAEILADIFYLALPEGFQVIVDFCGPTLYQSYIVARGPVLPWSFGHVCSSWRQVAFTDRRPWNRIQLRVPIFEPFYRQILETVLLRSRSAPLDIEILGNYSSIPMLDVVLPQAGRISRLILRAYPGDFRSFFSEFSRRGRMLSSLTEAVLVGSHLGIPDSASGIHIFRDCPLLRKLDIHLLDGQWELLKALRRLDSPFSQLTELSLDIHSTPHDILCILKEMFNLVRCLIKFGRCSLIDTPASDIVLPHLEYLKLFSDLRLKY